MENMEITKDYFVSIIEQEKALLYYLAYNILNNNADTEDAVSEAIMRAWEKRGTLRDGKKIRSWLISIVINISKDMVVKKGREMLVNPEHLFPERKEVEQETKEDIWEKIATLKESHREVVFLYYYEGLKIHEIAKVLKTPEGTIKNRLHRARKELEVLLNH